MIKMGNYCCETMENASNSGLVRYAPNDMVTIETENQIWILELCPWCGKEFENPTLKEIEKRAKEIEEGKVELISHEE